MVLLLFVYIANIDAAAYPNKCFFSVTKGSDGVWWFVDPSGKPFISKGVDVVNPYGDTDPNGVAAYADTIKSQYGTNYDSWAADTAKRFNDWNLNTFGAWCHSSTFKQKIPYTVFLSFASTWRTRSKTEAMFPDVFEDGYATTATDIASTVAPYINDPYLMGYFLDNELWWGDDWRGQFSIMALYLNQTGAGYAKAQEFLQGRYNSISALNSAWNINAPSFSNLKAAWPYNTTNTAYKKDADDFLGLVADRFFSVAVNAIKKVDPNHLILGTKHIDVPSAAVVGAEGKYIDVYSFDSYNIEVPQRSINNAYTRSGGKPSLIAEYAFRAADAGLPNTKGGGGVPIAANQTVRANQFENYVVKAMKNPYLLGVQWFQWVDQPYEGRADGENSNLGLVDKNNNAWTVLTNRMKAVHPTLDSIHGNGTVPASFTAKCIATLPCPNNCNNNGCCDGETGTCTCNSDYTGLSCETYLGSFADPFTSFTSRWGYQSGFSNGPLYIHSRVASFNSDGLLIPVVTTDCPASCGGRTAVTVGVTSQTKNYLFGRFDFSIKAGSTKAISLTISWQSSSWNNGDGMQISINPSTKKLSIQRWVNSSIVYDGADLPFDPSSDFHTYSIEKYSLRNLIVYADSTVLKNYTTSIPALAGGINVLPYADSPLISDPITTFTLKQIKYTTLDEVVVCTPSSASTTTASGQTTTANGQTTTANGQTTNGTPNDNDSLASKTHFGVLLMIASFLCYVI